MPASGSNNTSERSESLRAARKRAWRQIKEETPDLADWLTDCGRHFGKPKRLEVHLGDERVWPPEKKED
jgi:hypothetical protein